MSNINELVEEGLAEWNAKHQKKWHEFARKHPVKTGLGITAGLVAGHLLTRSADKNE